MSKMSLAIFLILAGICAPVMTGNAPQNVYMANFYMDNVLNNTLANVTKSRSMDPAPVPDFQTNFKDRMMMMNVKGQVNYTNGRLSGLSKPKRVGECYGPIVMVDNTTINCTISLDKLAIEYAGKLKYGKMPTVSISAKGKAKDTLMSVVAESLRRSSPHIVKFQFIKIGEMNDVKFSGLGPGLNKYLKVLEDDFRLQAWKIVYDKIALDFQNMLNQAVAKTPFPW